MPPVSIFRGVKGFDDWMPMLQLLDDQKHGVFKQSVEDLRSELSDGNKSALKDFESRIGYFTPAGRFKGKAANGQLLEYSRFIHLTFPGSISKDLQALFRRICAIPYTFACYLNAEGNGLNCLVVVNTEAEHHSLAGEKVAQFYEHHVGVKPTFEESLNNTCLPSFDPQLFKNPESKTFDTFMSNEMIFNDVVEEKHHSGLDSTRPSPVFSYFSKPITNVLPHRTITLQEVYYLIKGDAFATHTSTLRTLLCVKSAKAYKAFNFDYVTFSGTFTKRNNADLVQHSGLMALDFDHVQDIQGLKSSLLNDEYFETALLFTSPSGDGLKWVIPVDLAMVKHEEYFMAVAYFIKHTYGIEVDHSGKDICRACFLGHDKDVFISPKYL